MSTFEREVQQLTQPLVGIINVHFLQDDDSNQQCAVIKVLHPRQWTEIYRRFFNYFSENNTANTQFFESITFDDKGNMIIIEKFD